MKSPKHPDVLVIGGGIVGLACARELARDGLAVQVLERSREGREASAAAAGMLAPLVEGRAAAPAEAGRAFFDACRAARDRWGQWVRQIEEESGLAVDYDATGALVVALDDDQESRLETLAEEARRLGEPVEEALVSELHRWVPDLAREVRRALLLRGDHRVDNVQALAALAEACRRLGVEIVSERRVEEVRPGPAGVRVSGEGWQQEAGAAVLATGAWSGEIAGIPPLPVRPVRGQMVALGEVSWPWRGTVRGFPYYAVRRGPGGLLLGATVEEAGFASHPTPGGVGELLLFAHRLFPGLADKPIDRIWAGLRPGTPDGLPILGPWGDGPVYVATGHFRNGILLAPWTAEQIADLISSDEAPEEVEPFLADRFGGRLAS